MSMDRRGFLKIAGISAAMGIGGVATIQGLRKGVEAAQTAPNAKALHGKRWGIAIDVKRFKADQSLNGKCINACHDEHNVPHITDNAKHEIKWIWTETYGHAFPGQEDEYLAHEYLEFPFLVLCNHCENPACVRVCPTKATFKRESDGIVMMDMHRCIGCRFCMAGCPYGARSFNYKDPRPYIKTANGEFSNPEFPTRMKGVVEKCTFCYERLAVGLQPACVEASEGALIFGDLEDPNSEIRKVLGSRFSMRRRPDLGTRPSIYYIL
jgi:Fe-S-cluster-containing dehydrogenase component